MDREDERIEGSGEHVAPDTRKSESPGRALGFVLAVYAASRLFYLGAGALLARIVPVSDFQRITSDTPFGTFNIWAHWDGEHYVALAAGGYMQPPDNVSPAFFPLYPMLMRSFAGLFGGPLSPGSLSLWGVLLSLICLPFALYFVYRISEHGWGPDAAKGAVLVLAFFPTAFFLNAAYTESLFLALSAGSLWALRVRRNLLLACVLAGLATATRNVGVFLLVPLLYEWFRDRDRYGWRMVYLALAPSGLILYAAYLWARFGNPLLFYTEQGRWGRETAGPLMILVNILRESGEGIGRLFGPGLLVAPSLGKLADRA
ncbi:MAG: mannosyltransferase family protein [Rubrobacteraceae bacterium]